MGGDVGVDDFHPGCGSMKNRVIFFAESPAPEVLSGNSRGHLSANFSGVEFGNKVSDFERVRVSARIVSRPVPQARRASCRHPARDRRRDRALLFEGGVATNRRRPFTIERIRIFGQKSELLPMPGGRLKTFLERLILDASRRSLTSSLRMDSFLVAHMRKV
jgi:hypothetical protein